MDAALLSRLPVELRPKVEAELTRLEIENKLLKEELRLMRIQKYGPKSEQLSDGQLELLESEPGVSAGEIESEADRTEGEKRDVGQGRKRRHPGRTELPAHLPRIERILSCTAEQCRCGACGAETRVIGYDVSEELDMKPAEYFVQVTKREKRACPRCEEGGVMAAPLPAKIVEKGKLSNEVVGRPRRSLSFSSFRSIPRHSYLGFPRRIPSSVGKSTANAYPTLGFLLIQKMRELEQ